MSIILLYKPNGSIISIFMSLSAVDPLNLIKSLTGRFSNTSSVNVTLGGYTLSACSSSSWSRLSQKYICDALIYT